jgi:carbamate kinase
MDGVEAVVDKDLTASLLARRLDADLLLMLTDIDAVCVDWGVEGERGLADASPAELRERSFAAGSMGPKVEAACRFVEAGGQMSVITTIPNIPKALQRVAGTVVVPD